MAEATQDKKHPTFSRFINGIADYEKEGVEDTVAFARNLDLRSDPRSMQINPMTQKESGSVYEDMPKWGERVGPKAFFYGDTGRFYERSALEVHSKIHTVSASHGNGLAYYGEDDFIYYTSDSLLGRYGPMDNDNVTAAFYDDFLGSEGGVPTNTHSIDLEASSSMYLTRADNADLSITGSLTLEAYPKPESLPAVGSSMTLISKWNENSQRSYKMGISSLSGFFGDGSDGALTISANTTDAPTDSAATGTIDTNTLSATNVSFAAGQEVFIHQTRGATAGTWQRNKIQSYTAGTITLEKNLNATYTTGAQVLVMKQYSSVTIEASRTWTAKAWNGTVGGIIAFLCSGTLTVNGTISAEACGFRGGSRPAQGNHNPGLCGESYLGTWDAAQRTANYGAGGGGTSDSSPPGHAGNAGGGAGHAIAGIGGGVGHATGGAAPGDGGIAYGGQDLIATIRFGSGGGSGSNSYNSGSDGGRGGYGGPGGGIATIMASAVVMGASGLISVNGGAGQIGDLKHASGAGGAGSAGSALLYFETGPLGTNQVDASPGAYGYNTNGFGIPGGNAGYGRIHVNYLTSYSGDAFALLWAGSPNTSSQTSARTSTSLFYATQDPTLNTDAGYYLFLSLSSTGSNSETLRKPITIDVAAWRHLAVKWIASTHIATFYVNGEPIGTVTGVLTAIYNSTALFAIGADFNSSSAAQNFYDGKLDEARVWNLGRDDEDILRNVNRELIGNEAGLVVYYEFDNDATDSSPNSYDLTAVNSPTYSTDVPFSAPTSRLDLDQSLDTSGNTYTTPLTIDESSSSNKQEFVPAKDPQKSVQVNIAAKGTGAWTLTVHDSLNRVAATKTVTNANLPSSGDFEFVFDTPWRPVIGATYHFHITSTVADGTVVTTNAGNLNTADFHTYYQFLVTDVDFHPLLHFSNKLAVGNERYLALWDAASYNPHRLTFPAGWRVRALGEWNEYLAIGLWRGDTIRDYEEGLVALWNGYSDTYSLFIKVPEGAINALFGARGKLNIFAGYKAHHLEYSGGQAAVKVKQAPKIEPGASIEILPGAVTMYDALLRYGLGGGGDSTEVQRGVYSWGATNRVYADAQTFDYTLSTENYNDNVKIGCLLAIDGNLLIGWKDGPTFGVDKLDPTAPPYKSGTAEFLIRDDGYVWDERIAHVVRADHEVLLSGESVGVKYKLDRESDWQEMETPQATAGEVNARLPIPPETSRNREYQMAVDLFTTTTTSPKVLSVALEESPVTEETVF